MKLIRLANYLAAATTLALAGHAQSLVVTSIYQDHNYDAAYTNGTGLSSNQTLAVGSSISDLGASAWAGGSYISGGGTYNQATALAFVQSTAVGGDSFGRMAVTMEYTDFGSPWNPGTTLWYSNTIENGDIAGGSFNSDNHSSTPNKALRVLNGDQVTLGVSVQDRTYGKDSSVGNGATFLASNAPDVTISGGTASWSVLDNSAADTDLEVGSTMINRNGGLLNLSYVLADLNAQRALVSSFAGTVGSPFQDDVLATLTLKITGENAAGVTDTFTLSTIDGSIRFSADSTFTDLDFDAINGTALFDPTAWADGDFTLSFDASINQLAYGHENSYLDSLLLGSLSASQSFTLFTGASAVPEPSSYGLFASLAALGLTTRRRRPQIQPRTSA